MKSRKVCLVLVLILLFGVAATSQASTSFRDEDNNKTIYTSNFTTIGQPVGSNSQFSHTFTSVPEEGFDISKGTLSFRWSPMSSDKGRKNANAPTFDVYVGDPDTPFENWFQLADDFKNRSGKVTLKLSSEMLSSILADGNGNFAFAIIPSTNVFLKSGSLRVNGTPVPLPGASWLLGSGLFALIGFRRSLQS